jgi:hypothetical protein
MNLFANRTNMYLFIGVAAVAVILIALPVFFGIEVFDMARDIGDRLLGGFIDWLEGWL